MAEIKKSLGIYSNDEDNLLQKEKTALLALLNQLKNDSVSCTFESEPFGNNKNNLFAVIKWNADTNRESLQLKRRIEKILSQVGKK